jgi:uncharacterized protein YegP (UPF0339 family)
MEGLRFVIYRDNSAQFHWRLMGDDGSKVAVSAAMFAAAEDAGRAPADVCEHAGSATGTEG